MSDETCDCWQTKPATHLEPAEWDERFPETAPHTIDGTTACTEDRQ